MTQVSRRMVVVANTVYAAALIGLALAPQLPEGGPGLPEELAHALAYGLQAGLLCRLFREWLGSASAVSAAFVSATGFGLFTEALQILAPHRNFQSADLAWNAAGALVVCIVWFTMERAVRETLRRADGR